MSQRMNRRVMLAVGVVMACLPVSTVHAAGAEPTPPGLEKREVDVPVVNGSFSQPQVEIGSKKEWEQIVGDPPRYWGRTEPKKAAGVVVAAGEYRANRGKDGQAVRVDALRVGENKLGDEHLKTRLWDVRRDSSVTVKFEYAPTSDAGGCESTMKDNDQRTEQRKPIDLYVLTDTSGREHTEVAGPIKVQAPSFKDETVGTEQKSVSRADWQKAEVKFTAEVDNPEVAFALSGVKYGKDGNTDVDKECHPMIAAVSARQRPIEVDKSSRKSDLPPAQAYKGNDFTGDVGKALEACNSAKPACRFTLNQRYSYGYYDRPRPIGEVYENCTFSESQASAALRDKRKVVYRERSFDSVNQAAHTQFLDSGSHQGLVGDDLSHDVTHAAPGTGTAQDTQQANHGKAAVHFAAAYEKVRDQPWQWSRTVERDIDVVTPKNHASWVEVSAARERADGHYTATDKDPNGEDEPTVDRLFVTYDGPSRITSDRVFQRHGTLSPTEVARCKTHRPLPYTPATEPVVPYDPKDRDVKDESLTPGTAVSKRNMPPATK
ncbi:hypothetical protein [Streptomyces huasconensis]|uniref:hypothetical protein n=1 Tax=Streptomyces huasconensis TaxID=1854574 RepID=UPI0036F8DDF3